MLNGHSQGSRFDATVRNEDTTLKPVIWAINRTKVLDPLLVLSVYFHYTKDCLRENKTSHKMAAINKCKMYLLCYCNVCNVAILLPTRVI